MQGGWVVSKFRSVGGASLAGPGIGPDKQRFSRADWFGPSAGQAVTIALLLLGCEQIFGLCGFGFGWPVAGYRSRRAATLTRGLVRS